MQPAGSSDALLTYEFVEDLRAVHHLGLPAIQHLAELPRDERLAGAGRPIQQHALHMPADSTRSQRNTDRRCKCCQSTNRHDLTTLCHMLGHLSITPAASFCIP